MRVLAIHVQFANNVEGTTITNNEFPYVITTNRESRIRAYQFGVSLIRTLHFRDSSDDGGNSIEMKNATEIISSRCCIAKPRSLEAAQVLSVSARCTAACPCKQTTSVRCSRRFLQLIKSSIVYYLIGTEFSHLHSGLSDDPAE